MRPISLFQGLVLLCIGLVIIHLNTIYIPGDATDYVIQYTTIIANPRDWKKILLALLKLFEPK